MTLLGGGLAYALLLAQVLTSNDASVEALGRKRWTLLLGAAMAVRVARRVKQRTSSWGSAEPADEAPA